MTYDFGRYAGGTGFLRAKGPGILRVWSDHEAFLKGQAPEGDVRTLTYKTSKEVDDAIMGDFSAKIAKGKERPGRQGFKEYQLAENYDLTENNCTTICLGAMGGAQEKTGFKFPGYEGFRGEYDPRDLFKGVSRGQRQRGHIRGFQERSQVVLAMKQLLILTGVLALGFAAGWLLSPGPFRHWYKSSKRSFWSTWWTASSESSEGSRRGR